MHLTVDRSAGIPLYEQIAREIQRRIRNGSLPPGTRLPTVRDLARQLGVTRLTVHSAYGELQSGGWVEATVGRGTFVAPQIGAPGELEFGRELSARGLLGDMVRMAQVPGMRSLAMADAAPEFYPTREFGKALEEALGSGPAALGYTVAQGDPQLRTVLADLVAERGVSASPDEILITAGVTQGLALLARTLAQPGDVVLVEQPTYLGALNVFGNHGLRLIGVPLDSHGMIVDELEAHIVAYRPRFIYTIPAFQNPSGVCMSPERRRALLEIAGRYRVPVVEDDIYGLLAYEGPAPQALKHDDPGDLVIYVSSLSKTLLPGARLGYIVATPNLICHLAETKQAYDLCSPALLQRALAIFIQHGWLASHIRRIIPRYRERRDVLLDAMARSFPSNLRWTEPLGGFCSWVMLPPDISTTDLYLAAIERGVAFAPGDVFFANAPQRPHMRLSFSSQQPDVIREAVGILGELLGTHLVRRTLTRLPANDMLPLV
ncbi:MAG TPA: PLP-dependent aminotransferase family protein [Roseiflexaceae bacterium]|nr:PLP-dependent aminotransferase family protein [Roseiflexaceae bacterium]HMP39287.1 PLP-dependent aminotransferase family protein [Roseiflexaceae bacterium]